MAKKNELKAYMVVTNTDFSAVTLAKNKEEALLKVRVHFYSMYGEPLVVDFIDALPIDEDEVIETK